MAEKKTRKTISTIVSQELYKDIQILSVELTYQTGTKICVNDLIEEGMEAVLTKYRDKNKAI